MDFKTARLRLTLWYILIVMVLTLSFSAVVYTGQMQEVKRSVQQTRIIFGREFGMYPRPERVVIIDETALAEARHHIIQNLINTNIAILLITGGVSYFLAGRTLRPIEQTLEAQKVFISDASHEIRTPLTGVRTSLEVALRDPNVDAPSKEALSDSLTEVLHLQKLTDSLLNLSQLDAQTSLQAVPVFLPSIFTEIQRAVKPLTDAKQIEIHVKEEEQRVSGDEMRLTELFTILVENAIKYSPEKSVVRVSWIKHRSQVLVSIADEGPGIPQADMPYIFDRFYRSDKSRTSKNGGYGIGLAIAKRITELHSGTISVSSKEDKGSKFIVALPSV